MTVLMVTMALYVMKPILVPLVFSVFIYIVIHPLIVWLQHRFNFPKSVAVIFIFFILVFGFVGIITLMGISIKALLLGVSEYRWELLNSVDTFTLIASEYGLRLDLSLIRQTLLDLPILQMIKSISGGVFGLVGNSVLILICTLFLVVGKSDSEGKGIANELLNRQISKYLLIKLLTSTATALMVFFILIFFNIQFAFMFGLITFLLNFIPTIGSIFAVLLPLPIIIFQCETTVSMIVCMSLIIGVHFVIGNIIDPKLMGESQGLHPAIILAALLFWGFIWGISGLFLAVPMTAVIKRLLQSSESTRMISQILEGRFK